MQEKIINLTMIISLYQTRHSGVCELCACVCVLIHTITHILTQIHLYIYLCSLLFQHFCFLSSICFSFFSQMVVFFSQIALDIGLLKVSPVLILVRVEKAHGCEWQWLVEYASYAGFKYL
uniref:(northern house mosquito) hypothetical protein n=1 Tax=Culex pipiens TaxID=7175 RepID=A0A8D8CF61_CULPI